MRSYGHQHHNYYMAMLAVGVAALLLTLWPANSASETGSSGQQASAMDAGAIRGTIFANFSPTHGISVRLQTAMGSMVTSMDSDSIGQYQFSSLDNGFYLVSINPPPVYTVEFLVFPQEVTGRTHIVNFYLTYCCGRYTSGFAGNTNCSEDGKRNLADIIRLIDRVYLAKQSLCCEANGNVDGDLESMTNLADITRLIDHVFRTKSETAPCQ